VKDGNRDVIGRLLDCSIVAPSMVRDGAAQMAWRRRLWTVCDESEAMC
jgi:hypothetical protein